MEKKEMENKHCSIVPYHDPTDDPSSADQILMFNNETPCLGLAEFPEIAEPSSRHPMSFPQFQPQGVGIDNILDPNDPLSDPFIWEVINSESTGGNAAAGNCEAGSSGIHGERIIGQGNNSSDFSGAMPPQASSGFGNPMQLSVWPVPPSPYNCSCCHILREIIHINGTQVSNFEIHGRLGVISHGVLDTYEMDWSTRNHQYRMFDFCKESIDSVKNFLVQYCQERKREGYTMIQDPLSVFYEALCVGFNEKQNHDDPFLQPSSVFSGGSQTDIGQMNQQDIASLQKPENYGSRLARNDRQEILTQDKGEEGGRQPSKSSLAAQSRGRGQAR